MVNRPKSREIDSYTVSNQFLELFEILILLFILNIFDE